MSIVPHSSSNTGNSLLSHLGNLRGALAPLKAALDERDGWELLAAAHEKAMTASSSSGARATSGRKGGGGYRKNTVNRVDLRVKPPASRIPQRVPRGIGSQVVWSVVTTPGVITTSTSAIVEQGFSISFSTHPQQSSFAALFDQWCVVQFSVAFNSRLANGANNAPSRFATALDFDNVTNLGSFAAYGQYSTYEDCVMNPLKTTVRSVKPCLKENSTATSATTERNWCDSAVPGTPWFGIRACADVAGVAYAIDTETTIWFAFRNQI